MIIGVTRNVTKEIITSGVPPKRPYFLNRRLSVENLSHVDSKITDRYRAVGAYYSTDYVGIYLLLGEVFY